MEEEKPRISRRQFLKGLVAGVVTTGGVGVVLGACASPPEETTTAPTVQTGSSAAPTAEPQAGGTIIVGWEEDAATLDPSKVVCAHEARIAGQYSDTLWSLYGDSSEIQPGLAESWEVSSDGLTYDINLRPDVSFHDGTPVNAEAVKWSFDRWLDENHPFHDPPYGLLTYYLGGIQGVETTGEQSLRITIGQLDATFASNMLIQSAGIVSPTAVQELGKDAFAQQPVGTGAWKVAEWEKGVRLVLDRNDQYWGQVPQLDQLIIKPIVENAQRLNQLQTGEVDLVVAMSPEFIPLIEADSNLQVIQSVGMHIWWIALNMHEEPLQSREVRQALNYAVNKEAIVNEILRGAATVTPGPILGHSWANDSSISPYPYDPARARELLAAAGYADGFTTRFWVPESGSGMIAPKEIAQIVQANLQEIGVTAEIVTQEWTSYVADWGSNGLDKDGQPFYGMGEMSWNFSSPDPALWLNPNIRTDAQAPNAFNGGFYSNPEVDELLKAADSTLSQQERTGYFQQVQRILHEDCPWIFMFSANNIAAANRRVQGLVLNPSPSILRFNTAYLQA